jgi:hypothetical protein
MGVRARSLLSAGVAANLAATDQQPGGTVRAERRTLTLRAMVAERGWSANVSGKPTTRRRSAPCRSRKAPTVLRDDGGLSAFLG